MNYATEYHVHYREAGYPAVKRCDSAREAWNIYHRLGSAGLSPGYPVPETWICVACP
jgi:hypothetical protein